MNFNGQRDCTTVPVTAGKAERISARRSHQIRRFIRFLGGIAGKPPMAGPGNTLLNRFLGPQPKEKPSAAVDQRFAV